MTAVGNGSWLIVLMRDNESATQKRAESEASLSVQLMGALKSLCNCLVCFCFVLGLGLLIVFGKEGWAAHPIDSEARHAEGTKEQTAHSPDHFFEVLLVFCLEHLLFTKLYPRYPRT